MTQPGKRKVTRRTFWVFNPLLTWCEGWLTLWGEGVWVEAPLRQQSGVSAAATVIIPLTLLGATAVVRILLRVHWITRVYPATANRCHRTLHRLFFKTGRNVWRQGWGALSAGSSAELDTYESRWYKMWLKYSLDPHFCTLGTLKRDMIGAALHRRH